MRLEHHRVEEILAGIKNKRIAVIGDLMLDEYLIGTVHRISPEAPVPVVDIKEESLRFGGAANVCLNVATLGAIPVPFGVIGADEAGHSFRELAEKHQFSLEGILAVPDRMTTIKTRVIGSNQQIVRIDKEVKTPISDDIKSALVASFKALVTEFDAVIFEDYNKGVITEPLIKEIIELANNAGIPVFVDPKFSNFFSYSNVKLFKPNVIEASIALSKDLDTMASYIEAAIELKEKLGTENILITLGAGGMLLLEEDGKHTHIPTKAVEVADVSGAGDTVISTLVAAFTSGATLLESIVLANEAAGIVVTEVGIIPITPQQLLDLN